MLAAVLSVAAAAVPVSLAMPALNEVSLTRGEGELYTELLAQKLAELDVKVVTARDMAAVLGLERQRQLLGCNDTICTSELAGALGVDGVVVGDAGKIGASYMVNLKVLAKTGEALALFNAQGGDARALLADGARALVHQLARAMKRPDLEPKPVVRAEEPMAGRRVLLPAGIASVAAGVIMVAIGIGAQVAAHGTLGALQQAGSLEDAGRLRAEGKSWQTMAGALIAVGASVAAIGGVLLVLSSRAPAPSVALVPGGAAVMLTGWWP